MKKFLLLTLCAAISLVMAAESNRLTGTESNKIDLEKTHLGQDFPKQEGPRSVLYFLEAYYNTQLAQIEIYHEGLGNCYIYILDSFGQEVSHINTYSSCFSLETISVPIHNGTYTIVIESETVYAYGYVVVH